MGKSDARFGYRAKLQRTDHDLSRSFGFTAAPGMLLPIFADIATPGDSYYIKHDLTFLRTAPLAAPAMVDVKVHYETFFIPMQMIYQPFENTIFSLLNLQSSNYNSASLQNNNFPLFNYSGFVTSMTNSTHMRLREHADAFRMADMLDLNADVFALNRSTYAPSFFPWQILAYHTIFEYFYRLDDKSDFKVYLCNWDQEYSSNSPVYDTVYDFMLIHQRPWKFDYFTSMYRSPIVSDSNLQSVLPQGFYQDLVGMNSDRIDSGGSSALSNSDTNAFGAFVLNASSQAQANMQSSTAMIRQIFANEKLAMITGRTRKTYDSQVLAHFGVEVPHDVKHDITLIAQDTYPVHIGEVTSLATTAPSGDFKGSALGDLAGKGWTQSPDEIKQHKFTAPCHGVIMTIFSVEPEQRYFGGFNRINAVTDAFDIPTPEFDRLGNMPMFRYEAGGALAIGASNTDIIGWKERYYFNKRRSPKATLAFAPASAYTHGYLMTNSYESYMIANQPFGNDSRQPPVARPDLAEKFYIDRNAMDNLMLVGFRNGWEDGTTAGEVDPDAENWNITPWLAYARDPFIVDSFEKVKKVSWMSKDGEPVYVF